MAKQRYFHVLHKAGAFIDDYHYAQDEIVPYNPAKGEKILWGQETDEHGTPIGAPVDIMAVRDNQAEVLANQLAGRPQVPAQQTNPGKPDEDDDKGLTAEQKEQVKTAVSMLEVGNDAHWNKDGKPSVKAVENILGFQITGKDLHEIVPEAKRPAVNKA